MVCLCSHLFYREFMFYLCYLYLFTNTGVQHDIHIRWCSCALTVKRRVSHGTGNANVFGAPEFTAPSVSKGVRVARTLDFCEMFYRSSLVFCLSFFGSLHCLWDSYSWNQIIWFTKDILFFIYIFPLKFHKCISWYREKGCIYL